MWDNIAGGATGAARAAWRQIFPLEMGEAERMVNLWSTS